MTKPTSSSPKTAPTNTATGSSGTAQAGTAPASSVKVVPAAQKTPIPSPLPKTWADIQVGSLVIGHEGHEYGWWEAIVTEIHGDVLTLRWRDYPKLAAVTRDRQEVALLFAGD